MEIATWIIAICAIISLVISIKNSIEIKNIENKSNNYNGNKITIGHANNNGRDGVHINSKN